MRVLVVLPTYNEIENVEPMLRTLRKVTPLCDVLVVDDASPDGTAEIARKVGDQLGSIEVAQRKAETALNFKRPTKVLEDALVAGGPGMRLLSVADVCMLEGGLPIMKDGAIIGAIGVSGMQSGQDAQVALAGLKVLQSVRQV